ncbi:CarD family transcriptional regulator [Falsiroseomonas sp.]|uniref:CarD family transcriptional regulator n=1 Tax=Falsiroseomonas sp. TaxID=2870721 RepID=UPI0034A4E1F0
MPASRSARPNGWPWPDIQAATFQVGDIVVYPTHGVGQVQGIEDKPVAGMSLKVIIVTFEENRMTLRIPVKMASPSGLRKLATQEVINEALEVLRGRARIKRTIWSRRAQEYEQKINSGDPLAIAEVVRDLHRNAGQPDQSFSERQIYEQALGRLAAELAVVEGIKRPKAREVILSKLNISEEKNSQKDHEMSEKNIRIRNSTKYL